MTSEYIFRDPSAKGSFTLLEQQGEPFDRPGQIYVELQQSIAASGQTIKSGAFPILQGPFPTVSQHVITDGPLAPSTETVVFARCLSSQAAHEFGLGSIDFLKKHAEGTTDVIIAIALRWDP